MRHPCDRGYNQRLCARSRPPMRTRLPTLEGAQLGAPVPRATMAISDADDLTTHLLALAAAQPSAAALLAPGHAPMSFGELAERIGTVRTQLARWGIARGDV